MATAALFLALLLQAPPQEVIIHSHPYIPPQTSLAAETNLVESSLIIRDNLGKPIGGFHASDFEVRDNGRPEEIINFAESNLAEAAASPTSNAPTANPAPPRTPQPVKVVTLFFDDLHTESGPLGQSVAAARTFIATAIPTGRISIATSSSTADLDFTSDAAALQSTLDRIRTHTRPPTASCPALSPVEAYLLVKGIDADVKKQAIQDAKVCICGPTADNTCLNSRATVLAAPGTAESAAQTVWGHAETQSKLAVGALGDALKRLSAVNGTRVMILLSTGFLPPAQRQLDAVVNAALRWDIVVHTLDTKGLDAEREGLNGTGFEKLHVDRTQLTRQTAAWEPLEKIADGTGGHFFHNTNDLAGAIQMAAAPGITYALSFNPGGRDGQFHNLKIVFKTKSPYSLQFRPGYFSPADTKKDTIARAPLDAAVFSKESLHQLRADVACKPANASVSVAITLDMNQVEFKEVNGRHAQQIVFVMTLLDPQGVFGTGKEAVMDLALSDEKLASLKREGLKAVVTLNAPAAVYQVRTIVREGMKGNLAASTVPIDLRAN
jgi:VWFA-related protein